MFTEFHIGFPDPDFAYAKFPFRPGYAAVGRVIAVGVEVNGIARKSIVFYRSGHASHVLILYDQRVHNITEGVPLKNAPFASLVQITLTSVHLSNIRLGHTVAVYGQGLIGNFAPN